MYLDGATSDTDDGVQKAVFINGLDIVAALADVKQKQEARARTARSMFYIYNAPLLAAASGCRFWLPLPAATSGYAALSRISRCWAPGGRRANRAVGGE